jgi:hypothetical protein
METDRRSFLPWVRVKVLSNCNHEEAVFQPVFRR